MMGLEERINEEMYVDTESILDDEFDRAKNLFEIYEDNTVVIDDAFKTVGAKDRILIHLIAWQYIAKADAEATAALPYDYFYGRLDKGNSTIRNHVTGFVDEGVVRKTEDGNYEVVVERLADALDRIEAAAGSGDN